MFRHKLARFAAMFVVVAATVVASGRAALAVNVPPPGGGEPAPLPPMDPIAPVSSGTNWAVLVAAGVALVLVATLVALYRSGARPRAARHA
ncbi:hypothetical protein [Intrasporangium sp.]|jgi:hypothetical protein|uniref:hypothetical protein n=1 Tax=Intrasporangium sp. TaxID=1925024 RepID=UPI00336568CC